MSVHLPDAAWRRMPGMSALLRALGAGEGLTRYVGGAVRDALAGQAVKDVDLATKLEPDAVVTRLTAADIRSVPTGIAHGTVTALIKGGTVEITTLRRDVSTDGRRATIAFSEEWNEDAARRDFTINALYADPLTGVVSDYFGGLADLSAGRVAFIGDPYQRIGEDHLRILRFFRFHARYGASAPDAEALAACIARANDLMALSRERIADELFKILTLPNPTPVMELMRAHGIWRPVLPEIDTTVALARLIGREAEASIAPDPLRRLASVLPADPAIAEQVAGRLKLSKAHRQRLIAVAARTDAPAMAPRVLAYWKGPVVAQDWLLLGEGEARAISDWEPPRFPMTGGAIVARGVSAGPDVARHLRAIERAWVEEGFPDAVRLDAIADAVVGDRDH